MNFVFDRLYKGHPKFSDNREFLVYTNNVFY